MSRFNIKTPGTKTTNLAGGAAFSMKPHEELVHAVLTTFLDDKYYQKVADRLTRIQALVQKSDAKFVANLAIVARTEFNLRTVSHILIGELAKTHKGDDLVKNTIIACATRPDDLTEIVSYVGKPIPKQVRRGVRNALLKFDRYQLAKYKQGTKKVKLVDLFNSCHPKAQFASPEQKQAWADLISGNLPSEGTWETEISNSTDKKSAWENLVKTNKIGYMALVRNINNLLKYGVDEEIIAHAAARIADPEQVRKSKMLPFRFTTAYENVQNNRVFLDALSHAMDAAVSNVPELPGKTLIAVDASGSMSGKPIEIASIFAATLFKANQDSDVILFDNRVVELRTSGRVPVMDIAQSIRSSAMGGGTNTSLVFTYAAQQNYKYDRIIILSDNEAWLANTQHSYNGFKKHSDPFIYVIDIQGYGTNDITGEKVKYMCGWSDRLLDFIGKAESGDTLVKYITDYAKDTNKE